MVSLCTGSTGSQLGVMVHKQSINKGSISYNDEEFVQCVLLKIAVPYVLVKFVIKYDIWVFDGGPTFVTK